MLEPIVIAVAVIPLALVYASFAEWFIHRMLMHRPVFRFRHFYVGHALVHHGVYRADSSYVVGDRPLEQLTLAWWAMPLPVLSQAVYLAPIAIWVSLPAAAGAFLAFTLYQASYEYFHFCMHVPRNRWFERSWAFRWINDHHFQHHRKNDSNLNIILPFADFLLGTRRRLPQPATAAA